MVVGELFQSDQLYVFGTDTRQIQELMASPNAALKSLENPLSDEADKHRSNSSIGDLMR